MIKSKHAKYITKISRELNREILKAAYRGKYCIYKQYSTTMYTNSELIQVLKESGYKVTKVLDCWRIQW